MHSGKKFKYHPSRSEKELQNIDYENGLSETPQSSKNNQNMFKTFMELSLEVEMEDSVKNLLANSKKCHSTLLDVTLIKPNESDCAKIEINTLKVSQVKNLIFNIERQKKEQQLINDIFEDKSQSHDAILRIRKHNPRRIQACSEMYCDPIYRDKEKYRNRLHKSPKPKSNIHTSSAPVEKERNHIYNNCYSGVKEVRPLIGEIRESLRNVEDRITKMQDFNIITDETNSDEGVPYDSSFKCGDHKKMQHVYTTARAFKELNPILTCKNVSKSPEVPCMCDHCGIASLLSESQKRPIITAPVEHTNEMRRSRPSSRNKECVRHDNLRTSGRRKFDAPFVCDDKNISVFVANLAERVKNLEERLEIQEERAVPKDYFKRIITKLISHFSPKNVTSREDRRKDHDIEPRYKKNYSINQMSMNKGLSDETYSGENNKQDGDNFWKWGEEILRPGIDLKNKILSLIESSLPLPSKCDQDIPSPVNNVNESKGETKRKHHHGGSDYTIDSNAEAFKSFIEAMSAKIYSAHKSSPRSSQEMHKGRDKKNISNSDTSLYNRKRDEDGKYYDKKGQPSSKSSAKNKSSKNSHEAQKKLNVSYMNPKLSTWQEEESQISFKMDSDGAESICSRKKEIKQNKESEKLEFLRTLSRTKDSDKEKLWESIWAQAKANGQTKEDKVTIQLPRKNGSSHFNDMIELEFSIGDIEYMLTKHKQSGRCSKQDSQRNSKYK